jgi:hypothetical protein
VALIFLVVGYDPIASTDSTSIDASLFSGLRTLPTDCLIVDDVVYFSIHWHRDS